MLIFFHFFIVQNFICLRGGRPLAAIWTRTLAKVFFYVAEAVPQWDPKLPDGTLRLRLLVQIYEAYSVV